MKENLKLEDKLKIAFVCNWQDHCGIASYSEKIVRSLKKFAEVTIFAEINKDIQDNEVKQCWVRGKEMSLASEQIKAHKPDVVVVQHEYGIFTNNEFFLSFVNSFQEIPCVSVIHNIYEGLTADWGWPENIIVHSKEAQKLLTQNCKSNVFHVPHGFDDLREEIKTNSYTLTQFGFGFYYKGIETAIHSVFHLKNNLGYKDIQYYCLCGLTKRCQGTHYDYCQRLTKLAERLNLSNNVIIIPKYFSDEEVDLYIQRSDIILFPYFKTRLYGASGAIRMAISNRKPVIASNNHLFDDLEGIVPRPTNYLETAQEIDNIFRNKKYRNELVFKSSKFSENNTWDICAEKYLDVCSTVSKANRIKRRINV